jgi:hypothetical protein
MRYIARNILFFLCTVSVTVVAGQQVISSAGASAVGVGVQLSWTVGEPVIETFTGSSVILTQGFHQTKLTVTPIEFIPVPDLELTIYPNPVSSVLRLQAVGKKTVPQMTYSLYNMEGKVIMKKLFENSPEEINMELYSSGTYVLKIFNGENQPLRTFKVIKD